MNHILLPNIPSHHTFHHSHPAVASMPTLSSIATSPASYYQPHHYVIPGSSTTSTASEYHHHSHNQQHHSSIGAYNHRGALQQSQYFSRGHNNDTNGNSVQYSSDTMIKTVTLNNSRNGRKTKSNSKSNMKQLSAQQDSQTRSVSLKNFELIRLLGTGAYGKV